MKVRTWWGASFTVRVLPWADFADFMRRVVRTETQTLWAWIRGEP